MEDLVPFVFIGSFVCLAILEEVRPGRALPDVRGWRIKGALFFIAALFASATLPLFWDGWLGEHRLIDATGLGTFGGAVVGFLAYQLVSYTWHRTMHSVPFLFRWFHQMHHSAERVDVLGAMYFHPLDLIGFTFVGSFSLVMLVGVTGEAALIAGVVTFIVATFQHANIRTPRWLGYIIHRPENHALHHARGVHGHNYGDIALFDIIFGTFRNPESFPAKAGYYDGASARMGEMLIGRDVTEPRNANADGEGMRISRA
jgi:sterol desaturase/sphingolipid hydroxylase (fatty acid hydroxylase superfamily)